MKSFVSLFLAGLLVWFLFGSAFGVQAKPAPKCPTGSTCLENPLESEITDAPTIIGIVIKAALGVIGAITLLMFVMGAQEWLTSAGNPEKVSAGAKTMLWAAIGALLVFASFIIVSQLTGLITGATGEREQSTGSSAAVTEGAAMRDVGSSVCSRKYEGGRCETLVEPSTLERTISNAAPRCPKEGDTYSLVERFCDNGTRCCYNENIQNCSDESGSVSETSGLCVGKKQGDQCGNPAANKHCVRFTTDEPDSDLSYCDCL